MTLKSDNDGCVRVYACVDGFQRINKVDAGWNIPNFAGWVEIDQSASGSRTNRDAYAHAQKNYFPNGLTNPDGTHRYIYDPALSPAYREATAEELAAEWAEIEAARVPAGPTPEQIMQRQITDLDLRDIEQGQAITDLELGGNYTWPIY